MQWNLNMYYKLAISDLDFVSDFEAIVKLSDGFNGADLRNVCTEAGEALNILVLGPQWQSMVLIFFQRSRRFVCHSLRPGVRHPGRLHESCAQGGRFKEAGVQAGLQACINALLPFHLHCLYRHLLFISQEKLNQRPSPKSPVEVDIVHCSFLFPPLVLSILADYASSCGVNPCAQLDILKQKSQLWFFILCDNDICLLNCQINLIDSEYCSLCCDFTLFEVKFKKKSVVKFSLKL